MPLLALVTFPSVDGTVADAVENTFAFDGDPTSPGIASDVVGFIGSFYNTVPTGGTDPLSNFMSQRLSRTADAASCRIYNLAGHLDGSPHGSPLLTNFFTLGNPGVPNVEADQVAAILRFHGSYTGTIGEQGTYFTEDVPRRAQIFGAPATVTGPVVGHPKVARVHPRARRRGRIFLGPLTTDAIAADGSTKGAIIAPALGSNLAMAGADLFDRANASSAPWSVWSRRDAALLPVSRSTINADESPHIIRRRTHRF